MYAVADGVIGPQIGSLGSKDPKMAGLRVHLVTGDNEFYYAHLSKLTVQAGQHVRAGDLIGYSGVANGLAHLHFAAKHGDPLKDLGQAPTTSPPVAAADTTAATAVSPVPNRYAVQPTVGPRFTGPAGVNDPGTVGADDFNPQRVASSWQLIAASSPQPSPETLSFLQNAQVAAGG